MGLFQTGSGLNSHFLKPELAAIACRLTYIVVSHMK